MNSKYCMAAVAGCLVSTVAFAQLELVGWDTNPLSGGAGNFGPSPYTATAVAGNISVTTQLTRGAGIGGPGTNSVSGAGRAWGGNSWQETSAANAAANGDTVTFALEASTGYTMSLSGLNLSYRRSSTGASSGLLQAQVGAGGFFDITTLSYSVSASTGETLPEIDLSGFSALQNVPASTPVTFRFANYGGSSVNGTWYVFDVGTTVGDSDLSVFGTLSAVPEPEEYAAMAGVALLGFAVWRRRAARKA